MYQEDWNETQTSNLGKSKETCLQAGLPTQWQVSADWLQPTRRLNSESLPPSKGRLGMYSVSVAYKEHDLINGINKKTRSKSFFLETKRFYCNICCLHTVTYLWLIENNPQVYTGRINFWTSTFARLEFTPSLLGMNFHNLLGISQCTCFLLL